VIDINRETQKLQQGKTSLYFEECEGIQYKQMKEKLNRNTE